MNFPNDFQIHCERPAFREILTRLPEGDRGVYQLGAAFQLAPTVAATLLNIRRTQAGSHDVEIGNDIAIFDDPAGYKPLTVLPLNRAEMARIPGRREPYLLLAYPAVGGFVPYGARRNDGSPHPHAGTGFAVSHLIGMPCTETGELTAAANGNRELRSEKIELLEIMQLRYDATGVSVTSRERVEFDRWLPGWRFCGVPLTMCIGDGDDLAGGMMMARAGIPGPGVSGLARWQHREGNWRLTGFIPVSAVAGFESSVIRDTEGALLFTVRGCNPCYPGPGDPEAAEEAKHMYDLQIWRSRDNGGNWTKCCHVPKLRGAVPVSLGTTLDGTPYVAGNPYSDKVYPTFDYMRETMCLWPLNPERDGVLAPHTVFDPTAHFGPAPLGSQWLCDHPISARLRLADGRWHHVISFRLFELNEVLNNLPPTEFTGNYLAECRSSAPVRPPWHFAGSDE